MRPVHGGRDPDSSGPVRPRQGDRPSVLLQQPLLRLQAPGMEVPLRQPPLQPLVACTALLRRLLHMDAGPDKNHRSPPHVLVCFGFVVTDMVLDAG